METGKIRTNNVKYVGTNTDTGADVYYCDNCQQYFVMDWETVEANTKTYPEEYYEQQEAEGHEE